MTTRVHLINRLVFLTDIGIIDALDTSGNMGNMTHNTPPDIFEYEDWRTYLIATIDWLKATDPHFSIRLFAKKCGQKSHTHLHKLLKGEGSLSSNLANKLSHVLNLNLKQTNRLLEMIGGMSSVHHLPVTDDGKHISTTVLCHMISRIGDIVSPASLSRDSSGIVTQAEAEHWITKGIEEGYVTRTNDGLLYLGFKDNSLLVAPETPEGKKKLSLSLSHLSHNAAVNQGVQSRVNATMIWSTPEEIDVLQRSIISLQREALETSEKSQGRLYPYFIASAIHRFPGHRNFMDD